MENLLLKYPWAVMWVWGGMITLENKKDLERTQKNFEKLVLQEKYTSYKSALLSLGLDSLETRRKKLT